MPVRRKDGTIEHLDEASLHKLCTNFHMTRTNKCDICIKDSPNIVLGAGEAISTPGSSITCKSEVELKCGLGTKRVYDECVIDYEKILNHKSPWDWETSAARRRTK